MTGPILFFDGVCNLCNGAVQFVIRHDRRGLIRFASLQSQAGRTAAAAVQQRYGRAPDSLIFLDGTDYYVESDAALRVARHLDGGWKSLSWLRVFPRFVRDAVYRTVARYRYRWFGRQDACMLPTPALKARFVDQ
jgi:predicted DCC family thiol-disulfide oxidoreductase YuxK